MLPPWIEEPKSKPKEINNPGKSLYKDLSKKLHPDKGGSEDELYRYYQKCMNLNHILGMYIKAEN